MSTHRPRRALVINRVYPPASGATGALLAELAQKLVAQGWDIHVLTGPHAGEPSVTRPSGVWVHRVDGLAFTRESTWRRAAAYLSLYPRFLTHALRLPRPDVIVTKTDPPMLKVLGPVLGALTGARTVHWAQDLYPEIAEALGVIKRNGPLANGLRHLSTWALQNHDHVVCVGRCMKKRIAARGVASDQISVVPNWAPASVHPVPHEENTFRTEQGWQDRFVVMYSGNLGMAHPFEAIIDAAAKLAQARPEVLFAFIGEGPRKADVQRDVHRRGLTNVEFLPFQPYDRLAESLGAADVHLVSMRPEAEGLVVPSKVYGVLAAGRPCIFLGPLRSEASLVIDEQKAGTVLPHATVAAVVSTIEYWCGRGSIVSEASSGVGDGIKRAHGAFERLLAPA